MTKEVLCIPQGALIATKAPMSLTQLGPQDLGVYLPKTYAETNRQYLQVIPYCVLRDMDDPNYCAAYWRGGEQEVRLHGKRSIGFGGHMEPEDKRMPCLTLYRELMEEAGIQPALDALRPCGIIRTYDPVGLYHLGYCYTLNVRRSDLSPSSDIGLVEWIRLDSVQGLDWEQWSIQAAYLCLQS